MQDAEELRDRSLSSDTIHSQVDPKQLIQQQKLRFFETNDLPFETEVISSQIIDILVWSGGMMLYDRYLQEKVPEFEALQTMGFLTALTSQGNMFCDSGESPASIKSTWTSEQEPLVLQYDNRSSFAVNIDFKEIVIEEQEKDDSDAKSIMSNSSRFSLSSHKKGGRLLSASMKIMTASKLLGNSQPEISMTSSINIKNKNKTEKAVQYDLVKMPEEVPPPPDLDAERLRLVREKKDYARALEQEKQKKQLQEELDFENKKKDAQKLLKHKFFTHDYNGDIILLKKDRDPLQLPSNLISLEARSKQPPEIAKPAIQAEDDGKKVKIMNFRGRDALKTVDTLEFCNQPLLHLTFKANPGSKLTTMQGLKKEGGYYTIQNRMRKEQYDTLIGSLPNRPVVNYLARDSIKNGSQGEDDKNDEQPRLSIHSSSQIKIGNREALLEMLEDEKKKKKLNFPGSLEQVDQMKEFEKSIGELIEEQMKKERDKIEKERKRIENAKSMRLEKITIYQLQEAEQELGISALSALSENKKKELMTKLHQEVEKFDIRNIKDPNWGDTNPARSQATIHSEDRRKRGMTPVDLKKRKQQRMMNSQSNMPLSYLAKTFFNP